MKTKIPNYFHFVFGLKTQTEPFHLLHYLCLESCLQVNRPDTLFFHYHYEPWGEYWDLIRRRIKPVPIHRPEVRLRYHNPNIEQYRYAHESDFVRLEVLMEHGGVYADIDTIFVHPIPGELFEHDFVLGREEDVLCMETRKLHKALCNALIMSRPQAEFGKIWFDSMEAAFDGSWSRHSTILPSLLAEKNPDFIHIEPPGTFYPYMWTPEDISRLLEKYETVDPSVFSIHLWAHLWWSKERRDFSDVHSGQFTEEYIRRVDTTYNVLARPFLPPENRPSRPPGSYLRDMLGCGNGYLQEAIVRGRRFGRRLLRRLQTAMT